MAKPIIDLSKPLKEQLKKEGITYPILKSNKKWGIKGSSLLDRESKDKCLFAYLSYLERNNIITINTQK